MEERKIKEQTVSLLGMGCMRLPRKENTDEVDIELTEKMIEYAYRQGITYYDTAYPYHNGQSEIIIGNILKKYPRDSFCLADKLPIWKCNSLEDVKAIFKEQLEKCQVEYFDFYLCHAMNAERYEIYRRLGVFPYLQELKKQGKIRYLGFSFHDAAQNILPIAEELEWDFAQIQLNYLDYEMQDAKQQYEILTAKGISVVVMEPIRGGLLANVCAPAEQRFKAIRPDMSNASWALRYVASFPNVKVILSGMSAMEQLVDNVRTFADYEPLTEEEKQVIAEARRDILGADFIPCTGCRYCMPCPFGVDIPKIFKAYTMWGIHKDFSRFQKEMAELGENALPKACRSCGKCMQQCPQHIRIPEQMKKIQKLL